MLHVADPKAAAQLLEGWHEVEGGSWRWTRRHFSVSMSVPAPGRVATLRLRFSIPPPHIKRLGLLTLSASVNGAGLPASSYDSPGDQVYSAPVPASALQGTTAQIEFELDKAVPPTPSDARELGVIVSSISLE